MQLIDEKVTAPSLPPVLPRGRLLSALDESLASCSSTVLTGRTGAGKTVLAATFAERCRRRTAWYKVDAPDVDPRLFFGYLVESIKRKRPAFGSDTLVEMAPAAVHGEVQLLAETFVYELVESGVERNGEPLLVVVDDLHLVYDAEWFVPFFRRLLPLLPTDAHFVVTGRSLPPAPLWRMRSKQTLCVVDEQALAFTPQEARELFASYGLPPEEATRVLGLTRGRAAPTDAAARAMGAPGRAA
jgi:LuxR family maltose regulon positive regulatory protein